MVGSASGTERAGCTVMIRSPQIMFSAKAINMSRLEHVGRFAGVLLLAGSIIPARNCEEYNVHAVS